MFTFIDLFSGIGGFRIALESISGKCVGSSEIAGPAIKVYHDNWPNDDNIGDITQIDALPAHDIMVGGVPCFAEGSLVLTINGYRPIEEINVGELVLTHLGRWRAVTAIVNSGKKAVFKVKHGTPGVFVTAEHPYYTRHMNYAWKNDTTTRQWTCAEWKEISELSRQDFVGQVLPLLDSDDNNSPEFWWVVGRYLADGWCSKRHHRPSSKVIICCNNNEAKELKLKLENAGFHPNEQIERTVTKFHIFDSKFAKFLEQFGKYAYGKFIPGWVLGLSCDKCESILSGILSGDGSYNTINKMYSLTTVSRKLALSVALLAQKSRGVVAGVYECITPNTTIIEGRTVSQRNWYSVSIPHKNRSAFVDGHYGWRRIHTIDPSETEVQVYNISVDEDESYMVENAIVHNCQSWSIAGKMKGFEDPRGQLWSDVIRLLHKNQPRAFIFENVKGLADPRNTTEREFLIEQMNLAGYDVRYKLLNAYDYGVPQNRERIFIVGAKDLSDFKWPQECRSQTMLLDYMDGMEHLRADAVRNNDPSRNQSTTGNRLTLAGERNEFFIFNDVRDGETVIHSWDLKGLSNRECEICTTLLKNRRSNKYGGKDGNPMSYEDLCVLIPNLMEIELAKLKDVGVLVKFDQEKFDFKNRRQLSGIDGVYRIFLPNARFFSTLTASGTPDLIATTLISAQSNDEYRREFIEKIYNAKAYRRPTSREYARIQGFPDTHRLHSSASSNTKLIGNAVPPPLVKQVAQQLIQVLK